MNTHPKTIIQDGVYVLNIGSICVLVRLIEGEVADLGFEDEGLIAGDCFAARVLKTLKQQAFVEGPLGAHFLCDLGKPVHGGDLIPVRLKTPGLRGKPGRCILLKDFKEKFEQAGQILQRAVRASQQFANQYPQDPWLTNDPKFLNLKPGMVLKSDFDAYLFFKTYVEPLRTNPYLLKNGGSLIIEPGQTLTAIDVNTKEMGEVGQDTFYNNHQTNLYQFNLNVVPEIVRLIKLLKLGGIILIDFPRMSDPLQKDDLKKKLRQLLKGTDIQVLGFTKGGLMELIAPRLEPNLFERF